MTLGKSQSLQGSSKDPDAIKAVLLGAQAHLSGRYAYPPPLQEVYRDLAGS